MCQSAPEQYDYLPVVPNRQQLEPGRRFIIDRFGVNFDPQQPVDYEVSDHEERLRYGIPVARIQFHESELPDTTEGVMLEIVDVSRTPWPNAEQDAWGNFMAVVWRYSPDEKQPHQPCFELLQLQTLGPGELYGFSGEEIQATSWRDLNPLVFGINEQHQLIFERDHDDPATIVLSGSVPAPIAKNALQSDSQVEPATLVLRALPGASERTAILRVVTSDPSEASVQDETAPTTPRLPQRSKGIQAHRFNPDQPTVQQPATTSSVAGSLSRAGSSLTRLARARTRFVKRPEDPDAAWNRRYGRRGRTLGVIKDPEL